MRSGVHTDFHLPAAPELSEAPSAGSGLLASLTASTCAGCGDGAYQRHCAGCGKQAAIALDASGHGMSLCRACEAEVMRSRIETAEHRGCEPEEPLIYLVGQPPLSAEERGAQQAGRVAQRLIAQALLFAAQAATTATPRTRQGHSRHRQHRCHRAAVGVEAPSLWADAEVELIQVS